MGDITVITICGSPELQRINILAEIINHSILNKDTHKSNSSCYSSPDISIASDVFDLNNCLRW